MNRTARTPFLRRAAVRVAAIAAAAVVATAALVAAPVAAQAADSGTAEVTASCASLVVKLRTFAAGGEVSIVVDGETQTDGDADGWRTIGTSFTRTYAFEPDVAHDYTVRVNSFADGSAGREFRAGTGGDALFSGPTTPCDAVQVLASASSCDAAKRVDSQKLGLEISRLRPSVTYLVEVTDASGEVVDHFQFRTSPVVNKTFSGLSAGETYGIRVTDQSNDVLSGSTSVTIPACAQAIDLTSLTTSCTGGAASATATLADLVPGRSYTAELTPGGATAAIAGADGSGELRLTGLADDTEYTLVVTDDDAAIAARAAATTPTCASSAGGDGTGSTPSGSGTGAGSSSGSGGSGSTGGSAADGTAAGSAASGSAASSGPRIVFAAAVQGVNGTDLAQAAVAGSDDESGEGPGDDGASSATGTVGGDAGAALGAADAGASLWLWLGGILAAALAALAVWFAVRHRRGRTAE
ncbi:hypothetical protein [Agromyces seonyuensis]|uniref:Fibronectin type III domain-containing protein n=1 Tax=Agromyces seonyuensis TaxID=2662446 RepID=A0A6I4NX90_9MICO|nr:hypothetical protein [Agromyces seonyuensis]MWB98966.1 hypothetical protein [Agromyces seonyuensis]